MEQINSTPTAFADEQSPGVKSDNTRQNGSIITPIINVNSTERIDFTPPETLNGNPKQQLDDIESVEEVDEITNTEEPILPQSNRSTTRDLLKSSMKHNDKKVQDKSPTNSFLDFMCLNQNQNKTATKSLAYDTFQIKKIRALYGRRGTFDNREIQKKLLEESKQIEQGNPKSDFVQVGSKQEIEQQVEEDEEEDQDDALPPDASPFHRLIIHPDSGWKAVFDVWILLLVGYSCISNIYYTAFSVEKSTGSTIIFWIVEIFFYFDFLFSWFQGFRDEEHHKCVWDFQQIAEGYLKGWFVIDFISIFPFQLVVGAENGSATKLFRMPRMLRMGKLLDMKNVKRLMKSFQGPITGADDIINLYNRLFAYKMMRLLIVLVILTYFQGCLWFLFSKSHKPVYVDTWYLTFGLENYDTTEQLITSLYFALTMLSTVGYGDLYPISNLEKIVGVALMMIGVSVFSIVMGQFEETQDEFQTQMGDPDYREDLEDWMLRLQRFRNRAPLPPSISEAIEEDYNFFMLTDRNQYFTDKSNEDVKDLPIKIKSRIAVDYLFSDMIQQYRRFFDNTKYPGSNMQNDDLIYFITTGLYPRKFKDTIEDRIIYDEYQEVDEMYLIYEGTIGIGYAKPCAGVLELPYKFVKKQKGNQIICDHYVINKQKSQWIYASLEEVCSYALKRSYLHNVIFPKFPDFYTQASSKSYSYYKNWIYKPISVEREREITQRNSVRQLYNQISVDDKVAMRTKIPTRDEYKSFLNMQHMIKQRLKRRVIQQMKQLGQAIPQKKPVHKQVQFFQQPSPATGGTQIEPEYKGPVPDQYEKLKLQEELENNFYPTIDTMCYDKLDDAIFNSRKMVNKGNKDFLLFVERLKSLDCNNLKNVNLVQ